MHVVHTDDEARALRYRWLGPDEYRAPWDWTGPQWGAALAALAAGIATTAILGPGLLGWIAGALASIGIAIYVGGPLTGRFVATDTGLKYHFLTFLEEVAARRPQDSPRTIRSALRPALIAHLKKGQL